VLSGSTNGILPGLFKAYKRNKELLSVLLTL
jgi:hypothetical protein